MVVLSLNTQVYNVVHWKTSHEKLWSEGYVCEAEGDDTSCTGKVTI
jgi:hypothetical protein